MIDNPAFGLLANKGLVWLSIRLSDHKLESQVTLASSSPPSSVFDSLVLFYTRLA